MNPNEDEDLTMFEEYKLYPKEKYTQLLKPDEINILLFQCGCNVYYQQTKKLDFNNNHKYPLIFCLGGMGIKYIINEIRI